MNFAVEHVAKRSPLNGTRAGGTNPTMHTGRAAPPRAALRAAAAEETATPQMLIICMETNIVPLTARARGH